jgi:4-hydroxymandelate oxidase
MDKRDLANVFDYETEAREKLPKTADVYYRSGANDEITLHDNHAAYERIQLKPKVLIDTSKRDLATTVLGQTVSMPILVAPAAFHCMAHPEGEVATVRAAGKAGTLMMLSTLSTSSIEEVMPEATGPVWFQLYVYKDREATLSLVDRAVSSGCTAIALTVDAQVWGRRERDIKNRFRLPKGLSIKNLMPAGREQFPDEKKDSGLGVQAVGVGRPFIWGLAVDSEQGASRVLDILRKDFELTMRRCGCATIDEINKDLLV